MNRFEIRNMTRNEVRQIASEWAANVGWNPGEKDANCFYETDRNGFYVGLLNNEPIACISVVKYVDNFAFLGFYIVKEQYRGKGYGYKIWKHSIKDLKDHNIGLDGVINQQENYKKSGFKLAYINLRFEGISKKYDMNCNQIVSVNDINFEDILDYDAQFFPVRRKTFLKQWLEAYNGNTIIYFDKNIIKGYGVIRKCKIGYKIGPLFADNPIIADIIFKALNNMIPVGNPIYFDIPEVNSSAIQLVDKYAMQEVFGTARMYTKDEPKIDQNKVFGVTTFELG